MTGTYGLALAPVAFGERGGKRAQRHQDRAQPHPAHHRFVVQAHRPCAAVADRLTHRDGQIPEQSRIDGRFRHHRSGCQIAAFLRVHAGHRRTAASHLEAGFIGDVVGAADVLHLDETEFVASQFPNIARIHLQVVLHRKLAGGDDADDTYGKPEVRDQHPAITRGQAAQPLQWPGGGSHALP